MVETMLLTTYFNGNTFLADSIKSQGETGEDA